MRLTEQRWDYVIVGAGSAGCVLAERLTRDPATQVLLLEAGGPNDSLFIRMPKGMGRASVQPRHAWHVPVAQERAPGIQVSETWVRGKGLGGSSAINGLIWLRGEPSDYDAWAALGCTGWDGAAMTAAFETIERDWVSVEDGTIAPAVGDAFRAAGETERMRWVADVNTAAGARAGACPRNVRNGQRDGGAQTFLKAARGRRNLHVALQAQADRIEFAEQRAAALHAVIAGERMRIPVAGEVILSAGVLGSPTILQRSGVGDGALLQRLGITPVADRPAVGAHIRDHVGLATQFALGPGQIGGNRDYRGARLIANGLRFLAGFGGPLSNAAYALVAFAHSREGLAKPDLELLAGDFSLQRSIDPKKPVPFATVEKTPGFSIYAQLIQTLSEGSIAITAADPFAQPVITPNWLSHPDDQLSAVASLRLIRRFAGHVRDAGVLGAETWPGVALDGDDEALLDTFRRYLNPGTHAVGACRMGAGASDPLDPQLRARGVSGVRVVDCSAMPTPVSGGTHGPATAFAWIAAEIIARDRTQTKDAA